MTITNLLPSISVAKVRLIVKRHRSGPKIASFVSKLIVAMSAIGGWGIYSQGAIAQSVTEGGGDGRITVFDDGGVFLDNNAFDFRTGDLENESNIPLPNRLPRDIEEGKAQEVDRSRQAPNTINLTPDVEFIERSLGEILEREEGGDDYTFSSDTLELQTGFDVRYRPGNHDFGEGIQTTVIGPDGQQINQETLFVRGDRITIGPEGQTLPTEDSTTVVYGANDVVELRVLNLRNNNEEAKESAIYFSNDGEFVVEDLPNGGDLDFDDGEYVQISEGQGRLNAEEESTTVTDETEVTETPLEPEIREEINVLESDTTTEVVEFDEEDELFRDFGEVSLPDAVGTWLGHASGARAEDGEQLIYSRYTNESQFRLGSDGVTATGQLRPLIGNPKAPPTLLNGNVNFNPFVGDNEAGVTGTLGITQYLNPTHRVARDAFGNEVVSPDGTRLLEPAGLFTRRSVVGYVPDRAAEMVRGEQIFSTNGIIDVPADMGLAILAPDPSLVGRGDSAYTDNVGGLLLEKSTGETVFVPQWNGSGYSQAEIQLTAGEVQRIVYALVPQQAGQNLALGQDYAVTEGANGYLIEDGGFIVISADRQPENFAQEMTEVYAVEDTLATVSNAQTQEFNGVRGVYAETVGGARIPTVDVTVPTEADARVGNNFLPQTLREERIGQPPVMKTANRALGFYIDGGLTAGIGNQEDSVARSIRTMQQSTDQIRRIQEVTRFSTPLTQRDEVVTRVTETARSSGVAFFNINENGELSDVTFDERDRTVLDRSEEQISESSSIVRGEEIQLDSEPFVEEETEEIAGDMIELDERVDTDTDSYANFSAVRGEIALGSVFNFGNTPWTTAANTIRAELFAQDTVIGRGGDEGDFGWRAEVAFHPFGEVKRDAYRYDESGNAVPIYQTEAVRDADGNAVVETLTDADGNTIEVAVNDFVFDENGEKKMASVGTGVARGPGVYLRVQDVFDDNKGVVVAGGLQYSF